MGHDQFAVIGGVQLKMRCGSELINVAKIETEAERTNRHAGKWEKAPGKAYRGKFMVYVAVGESVTEEVRQLKGRVLGESDQLKLPAGLAVIIPSDEQLIHFLGQPTFEALHSSFKIPEAGWIDTAIVQWAESLAAAAAS